ncbi:helix-turn-helix transcriptional regulator [Microbacterium sp. 2FI]|uniref:helix-turn-helix transcriptional regulator n=1 Tax=Microbacterium sp. 2FI TaxID=2502193 RepID=UPI0010F6EC20|nr:helix-turn-helix transcriptional regulator [Microbacterium sp. 2FI]
MQPTPATPTDVALVLNREKLDDLRRAHGIATEAELARRIGVNPSTLWRVSNGEVQPSTPFIARVLLAFPSARMDDLFRAERVERVAS